MRPGVLIHASAVRERQEYVRATREQLNDKRQALAAARATQGHVTTQLADVQLRLTRTYRTKTHGCSWMMARLLPFTVLDSIVLVIMHF